MSSWDKGVRKAKHGRAFNKGKGAQRVVPNDPFEDGGKQVAKARGYKYRSNTETRENKQTESDLVAILGRGKGKVKAVVKIAGRDQRREMRRAPSEEDIIKVKPRPKPPREPNWSSVTMRGLSNANQELLYEWRQRKFMLLAIAFLQLAFILSLSLLVAKGREGYLFLAFVIANALILCRRWFVMGYILFAYRKANADHRYQAPLLNLMLGAWNGCNRLSGRFRVMFTFMDNFLCVSQLYHLHKLAEFSDGMDVIMYSTVVGVHMGLSAAMNEHLHHFRSGGRVRILYRYVCGMTLLVVVEALILSTKALTEAFDADAAADAAAVAGADVDANAVTMRLQLALEPWQIWPLLVASLELSLVMANMPVVLAKLALEDPVVQKKGKEVGRDGSGGEGGGTAEEDGAGLEGAGNIILEAAANTTARAANPTSSVLEGGGVYEEQRAPAAADVMSPAGAPAVAAKYVYQDADGRANGTIDYTPQRLASNKSPCEGVVQLITFCAIGFALGLLFSTPARVLLQSDECERMVGTCVWAGATPHGIFPDGLFSEGGCAIDKVRHIDARMCTLSKLHASIADMSSLEVVDLRANLLEEFPPELLSPKLVSLRSVDVSNNQLKEFTKKRTANTLAPTWAPTTELQFLNSPTVSPTVTGGGEHVYVPPIDLMRSSLGWVRSLHLANNYLTTLPIELAYVAAGGAYMVGGDGAWVEGNPGNLAELTLDGNPDIRVLQWGDLQQRIDARTAVTAPHGYPTPPTPIPPTPAPTYVEPRVLTKLSPLLFGQLPNLRHLDLSTHAIGHGTGVAAEGSGEGSLDAFLSQLAGWHPSLRVLDLRGNLADKYTSAGLSTSTMASTKVGIPLGDGTSRLKWLRFLDLKGAPSSPYDTSTLSTHELLGADMSCALGGSNAACCKDGAAMNYINPPQEMEFTFSGCYYGPRTV
jgi:hypothetical protein